MKMKRRKAREVLMQLLFSCDAQNDFGQETADAFLAGIEMDGLQRDYILAGLMQCQRHLSDIDAAINRHTKKWDVAHLPKAELAILRLGATEILYIDEVPDAVAINEAVELAKKFGEEKAPGFVNGVLGAIAREKEAVEEHEIAEETR